MLRKLLPFLPAIFLAAPAVAQESTPEAEILFRSKCAACHIIGGGATMTGPDLKGALDRQDREWLKQFILDPEGVLSSGDAYAAELLQAANGVRMPPQGVTPAEADQLLDLIAAESKLERSQFYKEPLILVPLTPLMAEAGRELFLGEARLENGGPSCLGCHSTVQTGLFGGGRLGPDLTEAYSRLGKQAALVSWLQAPPSAVMAPVFKDHPLTDSEINNLIAYLRDTDNESTGRTAAASFGFVVTGSLFGVAVLFLLNLVWRNRFRAVRKPLLESSKR